MIEAVAAHISGPPAGQALPDQPDASALALFAEWCTLLRIESPAGATPQAQEEFWDQISDRQAAILADLQSLPATPLTRLAAIWIIAHDVHGAIDPDCPALPGELAGDLRHAVLHVAALEPRLAVVACLDQPITD